ncbi:putative amino acid ABC transporter, periplasmic component [Desulfamplus magnetovallimortis]|uniref:Putative amino acid ABC transporter, periplasmic component n=1 Tax=Desulfamplus magnetovallimortis TaxID=1246637 RepID=A0A1W1H5Y6_9BACT|nr:transporter substrate-binding domain-containing protein [Desulfamplus magnetovallimortis]SLM27854.1 putative amino acid ABC transporter, periplasmic component [Desulfamplus magnetovallimortis]
MRIVIVLILLILMPAFSCFSDESKLVTLTAIEYPPYTSQELDNGGFLEDMAKSAFSLSGYEVEIIYLPWNRALEMTKRGSYDGLMDMWYRVEREEFFIFSEEMAASKIGLLKRKDNPATAASYEELKAYRIGVVRGYANPPQFEAMHDQLQIDEADGEITNLKKLLGKRVDFILMDLKVGRHLIKTFFGDKSHMLVALPWILQNDPLHIGFSRKAMDIDAKVKAFNDGIKSLKASGEYQKILERNGVQEVDE